MKTKTKLKTWIVPVIHNVSFGLEVEVQAKTAQEARRKAVELGDGIDNPDGYDWDRMRFEGAEIGHWNPVKLKLP